MVQRLLVATLATVLLTGLAQAQEFEAAEDLYAVYELSEGGRPLYAQLFAQGWPTDKAHTRLTQSLAGEKAELLMAVYLSSGGAGLRLSASDYELSRMERIVKAGEKLTSPLVLLDQELKIYRDLSGFKNSIRGFHPVFMPLRRSKPNLEKPWDDEDLTSWGWKKSSDKVYTLQGAGFAMLAELSFARDQLSQVRKVDQQGRPVTLLGRSERDGFFALLAMHSATAKLYDLRHKLVLDMSARKLTNKSTLKGLEVKQFAFPTAWEAKLAGSSARYSLADVDNKIQSRLGAQATILLAASELASMCGPDSSPTLRGTFGRPAGKRKMTLFPEELHGTAAEVAIFAFQSTSKLHVSVRGKGRASSTADNFQRGGTITPTDLGLYLMALERFINGITYEGDKSKRRGKEDPRQKALEFEQKRARTLIGSLSGMIRTWQSNQLGFYDSYSVSTSARQSKTKSLASQAFAIRGLLATHRAVGGDDLDSPFIKDAKAALRWLDRERWDPQAKAYVEKDSKGTRHAPLFGAAAVLGALRDMAITTQDGRYLSRYKTYLESLTKAGLFRDAEGQTAPGLSTQVEYK